MLNKKRIINASGTGLGKSVEVIACAEKLFEKDLADKCIVVCLATLKEQWMKRIREFSDQKAILIDGPPTQRLKQWNRSLKRNRRYVVMNYEALLKRKNQEVSGLAYLWGILDKFGRERCILVFDEATRLKNFRSKTAQRVKTLFGRWMWCLTATPIENRPDELYSIMDLLNKNVFGTFGKFSSQYIERNYFGGVGSYKNLSDMHRQVAPYLLRHTKEMVKDQLPELIFKDYLVDLDEAKKIHDFVRDDLIAALEGYQGELEQLLAQKAPEIAYQSKMTPIIQRYTCLRQICQSPLLLLNSVNTSDYARYLVKEKGLVENHMVGGKLPWVIGKIVEILDEEPKNKIVVFNFFKGFLRMIAHELEELGIKILSYTGDDSEDERARAQELFNADPKYRVMLCSDAGGYGVDLPAGTHLLNTDVPWTASKLEQRNRIQRLSSKHKTNIILTVTCRQTMEDRMYQQALRKRKLAEMVIDGKHLKDSDAENFVLNKETLMKFLRGDE